MDFVEQMIRTKRTSAKASRLDAELFTFIYETHYKRVYNYIHYRVSNFFDVDDLVSIVFEKVISKYGGYQQDKSPLEGWIIGIARNAIADYYRSVKKQNNVSLDSATDIVSSAYQPERDALYREADVELVKALDILNEKERDLVAIKFTTDLKNVEIAKILGISESNVGTMIYRSMKKLHKELERKGYK